MEESGDAHKKNKKKFHTTKIHRLLLTYMYKSLIWEKRDAIFFRANSIDFRVFRSSFQLYQLTTLEFL